MKTKTVTMWVSRNLGSDCIDLWPEQPNPIHYGVFNSRYGWRTEFELKIAKLLFGLTLKRGECCQVEVPVTVWKKIKKGTKK